MHKSTISRELRRNRGLRGYRPRQAQLLRQARREASQQQRLPTTLWERVEVWLRDEWSPEQISDWLHKREGIALSHEWIYHYIYQDKADGGELYRYLRCQKKRKKRYGGYQRRGVLVNQGSIDKRPAIVTGRHASVLGSGHRHRQRPSTGAGHLERAQVDVHLDLHR